ncbi:MAG: DNA repair protein RecN [Chthoniobacterales bacterium]
MSATLTSIRIRNLALVEDLSWEPQPGLNAISGETGAGKSVILGALKLLLGERADKSLIRTGAEQCSVEAVLQLADPLSINSQLQEVGAEPCEDASLLIKRSITPTSTKQFVNGSHVTLQFLKKIGDRLIDLHGPHDHQALFDPDEQTRLLDSFAKAEAAVENYKNCRTSWRQLIHEQESNDKDAQSMARELDLLSHQVQEIDAAAIDPDEEEPLLAKLRTAGNSKRLQETAHALQQLLSEEEQGLSERLSDIARMARDLEKLDPALGFVSELQTQAATALGEMEADLQSYMDNIETDPRIITELEERINLFIDLKRKYGPELKDVLDFAETSRERLEILKAREVRSKSLDDEIQKAHNKLQSAAKALSKLRKQYAPKLAKAIADQLHDLGFLQSEFNVQLTEEEGFAPHGCEQVEFLFCPNPGEPARPLRQIASSGEISRVMLAIKASLADQDEIPVLVFDEVDANIGGEVATKIGAKLRKLGESHQVFCITHLPQVAAAAGSHFVVNKVVRDKRSFSDLSVVEGSSREEELARMLGGKEKSALDHARSLLKGTQGR